MRGAREVLLSVRGLVVQGEREPRPLLDDVSFELATGTVLGLVGESGSGKTLTALSVAGLLPAGIRVAAGEVKFDGVDLVQLEPARFDVLRGRRIGISFQEPALSLSPVHSVGWQLEMALRASRRLDAKQLRLEALELLRAVDLPSPERLLEARAAQLSSGMRRRLSLALAIAGKPDLLIVDEPTTGLDTPIQAQILDLLARLVKERALAVLLITQDLGVIAELASELAVLYRGQIVEYGPAASLLGHAQHPYTQSLLASIPDRSGRAKAWTDAALAMTEPAGITATERGCCFAASCFARKLAPERFPRCVEARPELEPPLARHRARCFYPRLSEELHDD